MKQKATKSSQTAVSILDQLLAQARRSHPPGDITIIQKQVPTPLGFCRVAVVISPYGTHMEIGPKQGSNETITWTFGERELTEAVALLNSYLEGNQE